MTRLALVLLAVAIGVPLASAQAAPDPAPSGHAAARKPKKKPKKKKKRKSKRERRKSRKQKAEPEEPIALGSMDIAVEPAVANSPSRPLITGEIATVPDAPRPTVPSGGFVATSTTPARRRGGGPTWFFGVRAGPSVIDRRGYYNFRSNRQTYHDQGNLRGEVAFGRYLGRHVSLGLAGGGGPFPKFDSEDPLFGEHTRFSVSELHSRLDLDLHAGAFVLGIGGGPAYEYTTGSFVTQDPTTFEVIEHTATFKRFGVVGAARTGIQLTAGPFAFELLAEATVLKLFRGTYEYTVPGEAPDPVSTEGLSDRELGYGGSLLLGVRLQ